MSDPVRLGKFYKSIFNHRFFRYVYPYSAGYITDINCKFCKGIKNTYVDNNHGGLKPDPLMAEHLINKHSFIVNQEADYPYVKMCRECEAPLIIGEDQACAECIRYEPRTDSREEAMRT